MRGSKEKAPNSLAAGSGLLVKPLGNGIGMNTILKTKKKQLKLVPDTGRCIRPREGTDRLVEAYHAMDDRAAYLIVRLAIMNAQNHPRQPDLHMVAGGAA